DSPGAFARLGPQWIGWTGTEAGRPLTLPLGPGRYRARFWDPGNDLYLRDSFLTSSGSSLRLDLPPNLKAVFLQVQPLSFRYGMGHGTGRYRPDETMVAQAAPPAPRPSVDARAAAHAARWQLHQEHVRLALPRRPAHAS